MKAESSKRQTPKFEREDEFFRTDPQRQDFFIVNDGATWQMFPYIAIEGTVYSQGGSSTPDILLLNLGAGRGVEMQGRSLLRVLYAFQGRQVVSLALGETKDMAIHAIETIQKEPASVRGGLMAHSRLRKDYL
jgi:hypothetical protein